MPKGEKIMVSSKFMISSKLKKTKPAIKSYTLKAKYPEKCIGCELCVFEVQRQLQKIGLDGALIRILRKNEFYIEIDSRINKLSLDKIVSICPTGVFEITTEENNGLVE